MGNADCGMKKRKNGILKLWAKSEIPKPIIPSFHYSNGFDVPIFHHPNLSALRFILSIREEEE
jgi:hypothetical protein